MLADVYVYAVRFALRLLSAFGNIWLECIAMAYWRAYLENPRTAENTPSDVRIFELAPCVVELSVLAESVCEGDYRMRKLPSKVTMAPPVFIICNTFQLPSSPQLSGFYRCFHTNPSLHILATIYIVASLSWKPFFPLPPPPWRRTTFY